MYFSPVLHRHLLTRRGGLFVSPEDPPEGVEHSREPEAECQDDVEDEVEVTPIDEEHRHRWAEESAEQGTHALAIAVTLVLAAASSFTHLHAVSLLYVTSS